MEMSLFGLMTKSYFLFSWYPVNTYRRTVYRLFVHAKQTNHYLCKYIRFRPRPSLTFCTRSACIYVYWLVLFQTPPRWIFAQRILGHATSSGSSSLRLLGWTTP